MVRRRLSAWGRLGQLSSFRRCETANAKRVKELAGWGGLPCSSGLPNAALDGTFGGFWVLFIEGVHAKV